MKIVYVTDMEIIPSNCNDCEMSEQGCNLGLDKHRERILKPYRTKRPKECPLVEIEYDLKEK